MKVAVIGAGAAGCFCTVNLKRMSPDVDVMVFEAGKRPLAKVAITGGGRCNLTNSFEGIDSLSEAYPRGERLMKRLFCSFDNRKTMQWFESEGVRLVVQEDCCVFPESQDAMQIVRTLLDAMEKEGVQIVTGRKVVAVNAQTEARGGSEAKGGSAFSVVSTDALGKEYVEVFDKVVVTTGGTPRGAGAGFLSSLNLEYADSVPSLFSFRIDDPVTIMSGAVVENASVMIAGTKFRSKGPLLITDWGMSGPAILKLSSYAARHLASVQYKARLIVKWIDKDEDELRLMLRDLIANNPQKQVSSVHPVELTSRLWQYLLEKCGIPSTRKFSELGKKQINSICSALMCDEYTISGKTRFKEEFVTCGGVALSNINPNSLESKAYKGLYFAGEVLDVDAITGGFNLQAAWTMGYVVAQSLSKD